MQEAGALSDSTGVSAEIMLYVHISNMKAGLEKTKLALHYPQLFILIRSEQWAFPQ